MTRKPNRNSIDPHEAKQQFLTAMQCCHLRLSGQLIADGNWHRCDAINKERGHGKNDGSYVFHLDGWPRGAFRNWTDGHGVQHWSYPYDKNWTDARRREVEEEVRESKAEIAEEYRRLTQSTRKRMYRTWNNAPPVESDPYLKRKDVPSYGLRLFAKDTLLVPLLDRDGKFQALQFIEKDGSKHFPYGSQITGGFHHIEKAKADDGTTICISTGYATSATIHAATGHEVFVACGDGNLLTVAKIVHERHPDKRIIICGDDDWRKEGNPGRKKAREAARAIDGVVAFPVFGNDRAEDATDFNDMMMATDAEAVRHRIDNAQAPSEQEEDDISNDHDAKLDALVELESTDPIAYAQQCKKAAKALGISVIDIKKAVLIRREQVELDKIEFEVFEARRTVG